MSSSFKEGISSRGKITSRTKPRSTVGLKASTQSELDPTEKLEASVKTVISEINTLISLQNVFTLGTAQSTNFQKKMNDLEGLRIMCDKNSFWNPKLCKELLNEISSFKKDVEKKQEARRNIWKSNDNSEIQNTQRNLKVKQRAHNINKDI